MPRTTSGTFDRVVNSFSYPVTGTVIDPTDATELWDDFDAGLTDSLSRTGDGGMEAILEMGGFSITSAASIVFKGLTSGSTTLRSSSAASGNLRLPAATDVLVGKATTDTFTNKTFDTAGTGNSFSINSLAATANSGTGAVVRTTSATLIGPVIIGGTVTVVSTSSLSLKGSSSGATLLKAQSTASGTITVPSATDTLMGKATTDTMTNKTFDTAGTGNSFSINSLAATANTGTGAVVRATSATLIGPVIFGGTVTVVSTSSLSLKGSSSGATLLKAQATASGTITVPSATDTLVGKATTDTLTNKTFDTAGTGNSFSINSVAVTANSGTGAVVRVTSATLITPQLGVAKATSLAIGGASIGSNALGITGAAFSSGALTSFNATSIPAGGTAGTGFQFSLTGFFGLFFGSGVPTLSAAQGSLYLRSDGAAASRLYVNSNGTTGWDVLGSTAGGLTVGTSTITSGTTTRILYDNAGVLGEYTITGSGTVVAMATSPVLTTPTLGVATATSLNGNFFTTGTYTLAGTAGKTLTFSNTLTLAGTDSTTMTFPATSSTVLTTGNSATTTVGYLFTAYNGGTVSSGTFTPSAANGNYQYYTNNGAHTLANPSADCAIDILVTNGASAGTITFTTYTVGSNTGSELTTTNTSKFIISIRRVNSISTYMVYALQ